MTFGIAVIATQTSYEVAAALMHKVLHGKSSVPNRKEVLSNNGSNESRQIKKFKDTAHSNIRGIPLGSTPRARALAPLAREEGQLAQRPRHKH